MFIKLLLFDVVCFYLLIAFIIFYVKNDKFNTIEIMIENAHAKNRKQLSDARDSVSSEIKISLLSSRISKSIISLSSLTNGSVVKTCLEFIDKIFLLKKSNKNFFSILKKIRKEKYDYFYNYE